MVSTTAKLTLDQYDRVIASGVFDAPDRHRVELIHGELREMNPIGPAHENVVDLLTRWSMKNAPENQVRVRVQNSIGLPEFVSAPEPDIAWVTEQAYSAGRPTAADVLLIIEVADTSLAYDRGEKADLYATAGVQDYWIVNLKERCVEIFRDSQHGHYRSLQTFSGDETVRVEAFPQVELPASLPFVELG